MNPGNLSEAQPDNCRWRLTSDLIRMEMIAPVATKTLPSLVAAYEFRVAAN